MTTTGMVRRPASLPSCLHAFVVQASCPLSRLAQWYGAVGDRRACRLANLELRADHTLAPVLEGDLGLDLDARRLRIERLDEFAIALADEAAPHLARPRQLAVIGVELLMQDEKAPDLRAGERRLRGEGAVHLG